MSSKIQFIVSTGSTSKETKRAQRKLVRSHVTAQRYRTKRTHDVRAFARNNPKLVSIYPENPAYESSEDSLIAAHHALYLTKNISPESSADHIPQPLATGNPTSLIQFSPGKYSLDRVYDLGPEEYTGYWIQSPYALPPLAAPFDDPFVPIPTTISPRISKHLFYYVNVLMPKMHPSYATNSVRKTFRCSSLANADELSLSAMSAYSATSRAMQSGDLIRGSGTSGFHESVFDRIYFKGKTIKLVNDRLGKVDEAIADTTIGGICDLIYLETLTGNLVEAATHMSGLRRLAALRRKKNYPMPFSVATKILTCAVKLAALTHTVPVVPFTLNYSLSLPIPSMSHVLPNIGTKLIKDWPQISQTADQDFIYTLYDLASMTRHTEAIYEFLFPYVEDDSYYQHINTQNLSVEHRLLSYVPSNTRGKCVQLACILFVNTCLVRGFPISAAIIQNVVTVLRDILKESLEANDWESHVDVLFWVLFIGSYCTEKDNEDKVLVNAFKDVVTILHLDSWEDAKYLLSSFFYVERIHGDWARDIWSNK